MSVGLLGAFALLLGAAGVMKLVAPSAARHALSLTGLPGTQALSSALVIRAFGVAEMAIALLVVFAGGQLAAACLGGAYLLLLVVSWRLIRNAPGRDCGCFGTSGQPASFWHVGVNAMACLVAVGSLIWPPNSVITAVADGRVSGVVLLVGMVLLAWLGYLLMTALPTLLSLDAKVMTTR